MRPLTISDSFIRVSKAAHRDPGQQLFQLVAHIQIEFLQVIVLPATGAGKINLLSIPAKK